MVQKYMECTKKSVVGMFDKLETHSLDGQPSKIPSDACKHSKLSKQKRHQTITSASHMHHTIIWIT